MKSWRCWKYGGCTVYASAQTSPKDLTGTPIPVPYKVVGMQQLYDVVRQHAPENIILIGGLDWASDLAGVGKGYSISGTNIVYDIHVYTQWHNTIADWGSRFGFLTEEYPISSTEFGSIDCTVDVTRKLIDYFDAPMGDPTRRLSWTVWSWNSPGECSQPSIIADWNGTPLPDQGMLIYDRMRAYPQ